jgi:hypothetical protein
MKTPPTYTSVPLMAIVVTVPVIDRTRPSDSVPSILPFQRAMLLAPGTPPALVKKPPTYTSVPLMDDGVHRKKSR